MQNRNSGNNISFIANETAREMLLSKGLGIFTDRIGKLIKGVL